MADISLQDYLDKLEGLLNDAATDEVIHHCRHILQYFPKNVAAFRLLGRALVYSGRWKEAGEVFRRVLSVAPDDYLSHASLGEVYRRSNNPDKAIWHLERAFDQDPNSQDVVKRLRELYHQHRKIDQAKIQLTTGAVARHYAKNSLYEQAVDTLQEALERTPERSDLRLLLAQMLWQSDRHLEAAEVALDVLQVLPDCLGANQMMTELWLSEGRPSDAQRHLNRIEAVDPYLAYQLAKGESAPEDAFHLEELDYQRVARHQLVTQRPDWLQEIGEAESQPSSEETDDWMNKLGSDSVVVEETESPTFDADSGFSSTPPEDWMAEITAMQEAAADDTLAAKPENAPSQERTGFTGLLAALGSSTSETPAEEQPSFEEDFLTVGEEELPSEEAFLSQEVLPEEAPSETEVAVSPSEAEVADFFEEMTPETESPNTSPAAVVGSDQNDPLAWLRGSGVEVVAEETEFQDPYGADEEMVLPDAGSTDPLAWLQGRDQGALIEEQVELTPEPDEADPLAWLRGSGVEVVEEEQPVEAQEEKVITSVLETSGQPSAESQPTEEDLNALDWLSDEALLAEALDVEMLTSSRGPDLMPDDKLPPSEAQSGESTPDAEEFEWLNEEEAQPSAEVPDWLQAAQPSEPLVSEERQAEQLAETGEEAGFGADEMPEWVSQMEAGAEQAEPTSEAGEQEATFAWMTATDEEAQPSMEIPDWLQAAQPSEPLTSGEPQYESRAGMGEAEVNLGADEMPEWVSQMEAGEEQAEPTMEAGDQEEAFAWMAATDEEAQPSAEVPDWLQAAQPSETLASEEPQVEPPIGVSEVETSFNAEEMPEWVSQMEAGAEQAEPTSEAGEQEATFAWMSAMEEEAQPSAEAPDWVQGGQPSGSLASEEPQIESLAETGEETGFGADEMPEWVSQMEAGEEQAEPAMEVEQSTEFDWSVEAATPAQPAADVPDWLSALTPMADEQAEPTMEVTSQGNDFDWMADAEEEEAQPTADAPDWLSAVAPVTSEQAEPAIEAADQGSQFGWMVDEQEEEAQPAAEVPDWLSAVAPVANESAEPTIEATDQGSTFEWMADAEEEEAQPATEIPDWLSAIGPADIRQEEAVVASEADHVDSDFEEQLAAESAADWLSQIQPSQTEQPAATVEREVVSSEFSWLEHIKESTGEVEADQALDWMVESEPEAQPVSEMIASDVEMDETASAPAPAENAPDWLNAMVPGLDLDYEASEDTPIEQEYIEGVTHRVQSEVVAEPTRAREEFDWLVEIVDEETAQVQAVRPRFVFSRQPVWLRNRNTSSSTQRYEDDPEWLREVDEPDNNESEADDFDLPPWLR